MDNTHEVIAADAFADYVNELKQDEYERLLEEFKVGYLPLFQEAKDRSAREFIAGKNCS